MSLGTAGLRTHIWNNNFRSVLLLALYPAVLGAALWAVVAVAAGLGGGMNLQQAFCLDLNNPACREMATAPAQTGTVLMQTGVAAANGFIAQYWPAIGAIVAIWFLISWFFNTKMVRALSHSRPVTRLEEPALYNMLENLCISRGMKMPRLEIIETSQLNAFASGVDEKSYAITFTRGLLKALRPDEIEAVMAHELTHIINRDVRLLIISIIFAGMIGFIAQLFWSSVRYGMLTRGRNRDGRAVIFVIAIGIILWLGYIASSLTRFALSRSREFMADAGAVELTKNPEAMMRALLRIAGKDRIPGVPDDIALMCIENSHRFLGLFATHPPIERRVKAISETTGTPVPALGGPWDR